MAHQGGKITDIGVRKLFFAPKYGRFLRVKLGGIDKSLSQVHDATLSGVEGGAQDSGAWRVKFFSRFRIPV